MQNNSMPKFEYHSPDSVKEALLLLNEFGDKAKLIAGGTDVIPKLKGWVIVPDNIISLKKIKELKYIDFDETKGLRIGAMMTIREIENTPIVKEKYRALYEGAHAIASTQIRNLGTIVGNICNAVPSADSAPGLLVLDAEVKIINSKGERIIPIDEFFTGVCKTTVRSDELVSEIIIPVPEPNERSIYYQHTIRRALDLAIVGVAVSGIVENGVMSKIKIGLGAVDITPKRAKKAESVLLGKKLTDELIEKAAVVASEQDCKPITDMRATAEYRREIVRIFTRDAIRYVADMQTYVDMQL